MTKLHHATRHILLCLVAAFAFSMPAQAYIGPGVGAGTIAVVLGILASIIMALVAIVWYPVKRLLRLKNSPAAKSADSDPPEKT